MKVQQFQVDAFTSQLFKGNPAAVCPLNRWLNDALMQAIAAENNLSETAFFVPFDDGFGLRWFTPTKEVDLCGHATLATAHVLYNHLDYSGENICFETRSGRLQVCKTENGLTLDFPTIQPKVSVMQESVEKALGKKPRALYNTGRYMAVFSHEEDVRQLAPDMTLLSQLQPGAVIATAPGNEVDFVSRFFAPAYGIPEDPVTGSAHCMLTPFWATQLDKKRLTARQLSPRGGELTCELNGERVFLSGEAVTFSEGFIYL